MSKQPEVKVEPARPLLAGWEVLDKNGIHCHFIPREREFFGSTMKNDEPDAERLARLDRDWPGLAPHRVVPLYAAPPAELRRLHSVNAQLLEALEIIVALQYTESSEWDAVERLIPEMCDIARAAIAAAEAA